MGDFLQISMLPLLLTLLAYQAGLLCQKKLKTPLVNPILIAVLLVFAFFWATGLTNETYQKGTSPISWLMTPATVCLAIPMYEHFQVLKKNILPVLAGVCAGAVSCLALVVLCTLVFGFDHTLAVSLLPKSVTSAIGVPLSELSGGLASVTTAAIILTGIFAGMLGPAFCRLFRLTDPIAQGVALGTSGHVIATARANELSPLTGAVSSLSLVTAGLLTAAVFPVFVAFL